MTFYYYNKSGVVKMISETKMETDMKCVELPAQDLSGKLARFDGTQLALEENPALMSKKKREALESLKTAYKAKAEAGNMTLKDMNDFVKNFL